mgnify:CR=1 FL=1
MQTWRSFYERCMLGPLHVCPRRTLWPYFVINHPLITKSGALRFGNLVHWRTTQFCKHDSFQISESLWQIDRVIYSAADLLIRRNPVKISSLVKGQVWMKLMRYFSWISRSLPSVFNDIREKHSRKLFAYFPVRRVVLLFNLGWSYHSMSTKSGR